VLTHSYDSASSLYCNANVKVQSSASAEPEQPAPLSSSMYAYLTSLCSSSPFDYKIYIVLYRAIQSSSESPPAIQVPVPASSKKDIAFFRRITLIKLPDQISIDCSRDFAFDPTLAGVIDMNLSTSDKKKKPGFRAWMRNTLGSIAGK